MSETTFYLRTQKKTNRIKGKAQFKQMAQTQTGAPGQRLVKKLTGEGRCAAGCWLTSTTSVGKQGNAIRQITEVLGEGAESQS